MFYKSNHNLKSLNCTKRLIHKHITRALKYLTRNPSDIHDKFHFWIFMGANQAEFHSSFHFALLWKKSESIFFSNFPNSLVAWDWDGDRHILDFMGVNWAVLLSSRWSGKRQSLASSNIKSLWRPPCPWKWNVRKWVIAIFMTKSNLWREITFLKKQGWFAGAVVDVYALLVKGTKRC